MEAHDANLTKNKKIVLSVPDLIAIGMFLVSLGVSMGIYSSAINKLNTIETKVENLSDKIDMLNANSASYKTDLEHINKDIDRLDKK
ncbi:MAG TPA: hypothetical protein VF676_02725 [Flavobacterium sp.]|jgi:hypothetical protein